LVLLRNSARSPAHTVAYLGYRVMGVSPHARGPDMVGTMVKDL
jgi:hypothetical protein